MDRNNSGRGGKGGRSHGRGTNDQFNRPTYQEREGRGSGGRGGRSMGRGRGRGSDPPPAQQSSSPHLPPAQQSSSPHLSKEGPPREQSGGFIVPPQGSWFVPPSVNSQSLRTVSRQSETGSSSRGPWGATTSKGSLIRPPSVVPPAESQGPTGPVNEPHAISSQSSIQSMELLQSSVGKTSLNTLYPMTRPDNGGTVSQRRENILANYFKVTFNANTIIFQYYVDIQPMTPSGELLSKKISKANLLTLKEKLYFDNPSEFPQSMTTYDGEKIIFSAVPLQAGKFIVEVPDGQDRTKSYQVTLKKVNQLQMGKLNDYMMGLSQSIPRDVIQAMELVLKENPSKLRIPVGRSFFSATHDDQEDLGKAIVALKGFQSSLKHTQRGAALCLDYTVLAFHEPLPVIAFLEARVPGFNQAYGALDRKMRGEVEKALIGLKVRVTHRTTNQKYTIVALTEQPTSDLIFDLEDPDGIAKTKSVSLVQYFRDKYNLEISNQDIPCLDVGRRRSNYIPMEFCIVAEGQRYPNDGLDKYQNKRLKDKSLVDPSVRKNEICKLVQAMDGPRGGRVVQNFGMEVMTDMARIEGRLLAPPSLKLGSKENPWVITVQNERCNWNLVGKSVVEGIPVTRWALLDFTIGAQSLNHTFVNSLQNCCRNVGIAMRNPQLHKKYRMNVLENDPRELRKLIQSVIDECNCELQIILCAMTYQHPGYKTLKFVTETHEMGIGVVTQCFLSSAANNPRNQNQYLTNLAIKINAKLGGCNMQLNNGIPHINGQGHVMFIGADVNHPGANNTTCPSIAAVVASMNWPSANRYAARVCPQAHRKENIEDFGAMCSSLIDSYAKINGVKPQRIIVFRDGVSEGQFGMVLNTELVDLKRAIYSEFEKYRPTITVVVAQKRHSTRLFLDGGRRGVGNVLSGTVVDTGITHPFEFDFFLNSHQGLLGTSRPTHYYGLYDEHKFSSDQMQVLIYHLCYLFARCTKPVSLVPPVYYADLVAYRGRMYQEVMQQFGIPLSKDAFKLCPGLEDVMFFV